MTRRMKSIIIVCVIFAILLIVGVSAFLIMSTGKGSSEEIGKTKIQEYNTESKDFSVGIISDTQLPPTEKLLEKDDTYLKNLKNTLTVLKNNNVDMILFAGDIGDLGTRFAFEHYEKAIEDVFGDDKPIIQTIMGNHDFWSKNVFQTINYQKAFTEIVGQSPWTHYVVNGYHFIGASPDNGNMTKGYKKTAEWLDYELKKASEESNGKPIFVTTHNQPANTSYGSEDWGDNTLDPVLSKYPNVVNFSGHVHYSMLDERSVWQGKYTVINTQSVSYTEMEVGKENGTIPPNSDKTPMGYIMNVSDESIVIQRINFADGAVGKEEKADMRWTLPLPYSNDKRYGFEERKEKNSAPTITEKAGNAELIGKKIRLSFASGSDDDFVHSYKVVIDGKEEKLFFSDFYNGINEMDKKVVLEIEDIDRPNDEHTFEIYAVDSWGAESKDCILIKTNKK